MMSKETRSLVFFGSGPVAAESLRLLANSFVIEAIITKSSTEQEMGSICKNTPVYRANSRKELDSLIKTEKFTSNYGILIDFGVIVSQFTIDSFSKGIINSHFSLLPQWRGADPITFSLLSGQKKTGVSLMLIDEGMDTGKLITRKTLDIKNNDTSISLTNRLIKLSVELLESYLPRYLDGDILPKNQPHPDRATYSRKLTKSDGIIDWGKSAIEIDREIRAFKEWPKSYTKLGQVEVIVTEARASSENYKDKKIGQTLILPESKTLVVCCGEGSLIIDTLKPLGKKEMTSEAFIAGYRNRLNI